MHLNGIMKVTIPEMNLVQNSLSPQLHSMIGLQAANLGSYKMQHGTNTNPNANSNHSPTASPHTLSHAGLFNYPKDSNRCKLECGPMPNVMATLPNIGGARRPLFNTAKFG